MPRPMVGASDRMRISHAGCAGKGGLSGAFTGILRRQAQFGRVAGSRTSAGGATVSCQSPNAALPLRADFLSVVMPGLDAWPGHPSSSKELDCRVKPGNDGQTIL